jgi:uncharacterized protein (TIGR02246 family)
MSLVTRCIGTCMLLAVLSACGTRERAVDTRAQESAIRETELAWSRACAAKDLEATLSFYADDASILSPNMPIVTGKDALRKWWAQDFAMPGMSIAFRSDKIEVARSGDLAWSRGTADVTFNDPAGQLIRDRDKYIAVWRKQADGKWKAVADMFNTDLPALPARPAKQ